MTSQWRIHLSTRGHGHMQDITARVATIVAESGIETGVVHLFNIGSTAVLGTVEFEPGLEGDFPEMLDRLISYQTPDSFAWPGVPYASAEPGSGVYQDARADGRYVIEPDKVAQAALGYLSFYKLTHADQIKKAKKSHFINNSNF